MTEKPPIITEQEVINWIICAYGKDAIIAPLAHEKEAQRDADVAYYEPLLKQAQEQIDYVSIQQEALSSKLDDVELAIQQARQDTAREIEAFLQNHLYARPDRVWAKMKFLDWMKLKKLLDKYLK